MYLIGFLSLNISSDLLSLMNTNTARNMLVRVFMHVSALSAVQTPKGMSFFISLGGQSDFSVLPCSHRK